MGIYGFFVYIKEKNRQGVLKVKDVYFGVNVIVWNILEMIVFMSIIVQFVNIYEEVIIVGDYYFRF